MQQQRHKLNSAAIGAVHHRRQSTLRLKQSHAHGFRSRFASCHRLRDAAARECCSAFTFNIEQFANIVGNAFAERPRGARPRVSTPRAAPATTQTRGAVGERRQVEHPPAQPSARSAMRLIGTAVLGHAISELLPPDARAPPDGPWSLSAPSFLPGVRDV